MSQRSVSRAHWDQAFQELGWGQQWADSTWQQLGGEDSLFLSIKQIEMLMQTIGWTTDHAQSLWNNLAAKPEQPQAVYGDIVPGPIQPSAAPQISYEAMDGQTTTARPVEPGLYLESDEIKKDSRWRQGRKIDFWPKLLLGLIFSKAAQLIVLAGLLQIILKLLLVSVLSGQSFAGLGALLRISAELIQPWLIVQITLRGHFSVIEPLAVLVLAAFVWFSAGLDRMMVGAWTNWRPWRRVFLWCELLGLAVFYLMILLLPEWSKHELFQLPRIAGTSLSITSVMIVILAAQFVFLALWASGKIKSRNTAFRS